MALAVSLRGRRLAFSDAKADNIDLDEAPDARKSHKSLARIVDDEGVEHDILRDNMPFGWPAYGEYCTIFIGYSKYLWLIEQMLTRIIVREPPVEYDRILDFPAPLAERRFFASSNDVPQPRWVRCLPAPTLPTCATVDAGAPRIWHLFNARRRALCDRAGRRRPAPC